MLPYRFSFDGWSKCAETVLVAHVARRDLRYHNNSGVALRVRGIFQKPCSFERWKQKLPVSRNGGLCSAWIGSSRVYLVNRSCPERFKPSVLLESTPTSFRLTRLRSSASHTHTPFASSATATHTYLRSIVNGERTKRCQEQPLQ